MWVASRFFSKNTCEVDIVLTRAVNILPTNKLVKLMALWTTGAWYFVQSSACQNLWVASWESDQLYL